MIVYHPEIVSLVCENSLNGPFLHLSLVTLHLPSPDLRSGDALSC